MQPITHTPATEARVNDGNVTIEGIQADVRTMSRDFIPLTHTHTATAEGISLGGDEALVTLGTAPFPADGPWWKRVAPSTLYALAAGAIALLFLLHELVIAGKLGFPIDEGWVHLVYARNFFQHIAFEFNVGERTAGPAAPFWTVFVAFASSLFKNPIVASKMLGSIFLFLTAYYAFRLMRSLEFDYGSGILAGLLIVSIPSLAWAELAGIESTLAAALVVAGLWSYVLALDPNARYGGARRYLTGLIFGLAVLARPESALIFAIVLCHWSVEHIMARGLEAETPSFRRFWRDIGTTLLGFLLLMVPIVITNKALSGTLLPPSMHAAFGREALPVLIAHGDIAGILVRLVLSFKAIPALYFGLFAQDQPVLLIAILVAATLLLRNRGLHRPSTVQFFSLGVLILAFFPYLHALLLGALDLSANGHAFSALSAVYDLTGITAVCIIAESLTLRGPTGKQLLLTSAALLAITGTMQLLLNTTGPKLVVAPIIPLVAFLLTLIAALSIVLTHQQGYEHGANTYVHDPHSFDQLQLTDELAEEFDEKMPHQVVLVLRGMLILLLAWNVARLVPTAREYALQVLNEQQGPITLASEIGEATPPTAVIATDAIGALGYYSARRIYDVEGRLHTEPLDLRRSLGRELGLLDALSSARPQFLVLTNPKYKEFLQGGIAAGFLVPLRGELSKPTGGVELYQIAYDKLDQFAAKLSVPNE